MGQMEHWLTEGDVQRLVVVVTGVDSGETLERWQFNVSVEEEKKNKHATSSADAGADADADAGAMEVDSGAGAGAGAGGDENDAAVSNMNSGSKTGKMGQKSIKEVHNEIQAIIRQITASVSIHTQIQTCIMPM